MCLCSIFHAEYVLSLGQFSLPLRQSTYACCTPRPFSQSGLPATRLSPLAATGSTLKMTSGTHQSEKERNTN